MRIDCSSTSIMQRLQELKMRYEMLIECYNEKQQVLYNDK